MIASRIAATAAAVVLTLAPLAVAGPALADSSNPQGANFGKLYYDGAVVRTVATPTSQPGEGSTPIYPVIGGVAGQMRSDFGGTRRQLPRRSVGRARRQLEHDAVPADLRRGRTRSGRGRRRDDHPDARCGLRLPGRRSLTAEDGCSRRCTRTLAP